jgi:hypothetical protein
MRNVTSERLGPKPRCAASMRKIVLVRRDGIVDDYGDAGQATGVLRKIGNRGLGQDDLEEEWEEEEWWRPEEGEAAVAQ